MSIDDNFRCKLLFLVFRMALFANSDYINFHGFIPKKNLQMYTVVRDPKTGQVFTSGNSATALSHLKEVEKITRQTSCDWLKEELPPQWPVPLVT